MSYESSGALIQEPLQGFLKPGRQRFRLNVPKARRVYLELDDTEVELSKNGDEFEGEADLHEGGFVTVCVCREPTDILDRLDAVVGDPILSYQVSI